MVRLICVMSLVVAAAGQPLALSGERLRAHIRFLSSDLLAGRAVGTQGGQLTAEYLAAAFAAAGAVPVGPDKSYFQQVPLAGVKVDSGSQLKLGKQVLQWRQGFVATTQTQEAEVNLSTEMVFVGHGIVAPEYGWNDYEGADVRGKVVVLFTGEPPSEDPAFFGGAALTYYGRWTYKYEEAARQGAAGAVIIHTDATASYGWSVVENSNAREGIQLQRDASQPALRVAAWITQEAAREAGYPVEDWLRRADARGFRSVPVEGGIEVKLRASIRSITSRNVVAMVPGAGPSAQEHILYSAHWDHLGMAAEGEDRIFNGAVDNATGCAILIEMARAWAALEPKPRRTVLFVAVTGEESGLLGSAYYARKPLLPLAQLLLNLNVDGIMPGGKPGGLLALGEDRNASLRQIEEAARRFSLPLRPDPRPEAGSLFRSDHFSFMRAGVSAFSLIPLDVPGKFAAEYNRLHYHQPSDEYSPDWDMTAIETVGNVALSIGVNAASLP